jgi:hypothetical protein
MPAELALHTAPAANISQPPTPCQRVTFRDPFRKSVVQYKHENDTMPALKIRQAPLRTKQMLQ